MKVLVTGGTGNVGSKVISELLKRKVAVRALVRKQGVDKAYLLNAVVPDELTQGLIVFDLAKRRKVGHLVYHSVFQGRSVQGRAAFRVQTGDRERVAGV